MSNTQKDNRYHREQEKEGMNKHCSYKDDQKGWDKCNLCYSQQISAATNFI